MNNDQNLKKEIPIDYSSVLERVGEDESFLQELINIYMEDFGKKYKELKQALEKKNFTALREIGHSLKGSSANLSLNNLKEASFKIETAGKNRNIEIAKQALLLLNQEFIRLKDFLSKKK